MRTYPPGEDKPMKPLGGVRVKAEPDYRRERAREAGMKFDTQPEPDAPWKKDLKKLSEVLLDDPQFTPEP